MIVVVSGLNTAASISVQLHVQHVQHVPSGKLTQLELSENHHPQWVKPLYMAIFKSYIGLLEGIY